LYFSFFYSTEEGNGTRVRKAAGKKRDLRKIAAKREKKRSPPYPRFFFIRGFSCGAEGKCQGGNKRCLPLGSLLKGETFGSTEDIPFLSEEFKRIET